MNKPRKAFIPHVAVLAIMLGAAAPSFAHGDGQHSTRNMQGMQPAPVSSDEHAFGREGDPKHATRTVRIAMSDSMRFSPADLTVRKGETVRFVVENKGQAIHEMVIGTLAELKEHGALMLQHPGMEHDEPYMVHVAPGKTGEMVWQFTQAGEFHFGCLVPGHFEAGMIGKIKVVPSAKKGQS